MTIEIVPTRDDVVNVKLVRGKPVADIDALRKYQRQYYHAKRQECACEHCKVQFSNQSALARRQRRNHKCALIHAKAELGMLRAGQAAEHLSQAVV